MGKEKPFRGREKRERGRERGERGREREERERDRERERVNLVANSMRMMGLLLRKSITEIDGRLRIGIR